MEKGYDNIYLKVIINLGVVMRNEEGNKKIMLCFRQSKQCILGKIIQNTEKAVMTKKTWSKERITDDIWACTTIQKQKDERRKN